MTLEGQHTQSAVAPVARAERLGNVSEACRRHGMSRTLFYRLRERFEAVRTGRRASEAAPGASGGRRRPVQTERRVIAFALAWPTCGPQWYSDQLAREGLSIAPVTIWRLFRRRHLGTRRARLAVLEHGSATTGLLTERTAKPIRHVAAGQPGDLLSLDTFYVGKLKGVGKVWQITACDVASSFGWARLMFGEVTAAAVFGFPAGDGTADLSAGGLALHRVLTDNGKEF